ncbi:MAG: efflux RND transporter periplasmic adaptor subunit [Alphaproteobacteria bacterium]|nr:efflux RND transporter periplasmic adaptor subunit [Alphaproteobacteria bacterium]
MSSLLLDLAAAGPSFAQQPPGPPPAVGVVAATRQPTIQSSEYTGRILATNRVNVVARVSAYLEQVLFKEGAEVQEGDLLYRLDQRPFEADMQAREAAVAQFKAQLKNAEAVTARAKALQGTPAYQPSAVDIAVANEDALKAQVLGAEGQLQQAEINLAYTQIRAPIGGKIGRTSVTVGNYVTPSSGVLCTIVSQDPMYVLFPVSTRAVIELQRRSAEKAGALVIRLRLPDGRLYGPTGRLDFVDNTVAGNTDTMNLRGVIPNPPIDGSPNGTRELIDNELVTVILEDVQPTEAIGVPRSAVLADQEGDYVFVVGSDNKAEQRRVKLAKSSTPAVAIITSGLKDGEKVILDGIQRVRNGQPVTPGPASPQVKPPAGAVQAGSTPIR